MWACALTFEQISALAKGKSALDASLPQPVLHYSFETHGGAAVHDGLEAIGSIDETASHPSGPYRGSGRNAVRPDPVNLSDGELSLEFSSDDDDGIGIAFRMSDAEHFYLFAMDRERAFRALLRKDGNSYQVLASNEKDYRTFHWYRLRVLLDGPRMQVYLDGDLELEATDPAFAAGTFALYTAGCEGARFRNIVWRDK